MEPGGDAAGVRQTAQHRSHQPRAVLAPLRVSPQPEQVLGRAARRRRLALRLTRPHAAVHRRERRHRQVGEHPGVLAAAATLSRHDVPILAGDARQPARHHAIVAAAVREQKHAQHQRAAFDALGVPDGCMRQRQELLHHIRIGRRAKAFRPFAARIRVEVGDEHRLHRCVGERRLDDPFRQTAARVVERGGLPAPPGGDGRHLELLAEQPFAERRQKRQQCRRFEHAHAERVGDEHVSRAPRLHEPGNPQRRIGPHLERIAEVVVETAQNRVDGPET